MRAHRNDLDQENLKGIDVECDKGSQKPYVPRIDLLPS